MAKVIVALRGLEFSLDDIREILADCRDDADILDAARTAKDYADRKVCSTTKTSSRQINQLINQERQSREEEK